MTFTIVGDFLKVLAFFAVIGIVAIIYGLGKLVYNLFIKKKG